MNNNHKKDDAEKFYDKKNVMQYIIPAPIEKKITFFNDLIQKTIIHVQKNKLLNILGNNDLNSCIQSLNDIHGKIKQINEKECNTETIINHLQTINNDLSVLIKMYGTESFEDLLLICFGNDHIATNEEEKSKYELLKKYFHPTSYKLVNLKNTQITMKSSLEATIEDTQEQEQEQEQEDKIKNFDCTDISLHSKLFHTKVFGIKLFISDLSLKKNIIVYGLVDNIMLKFLDNKYILSIQNKIKENNIVDCHYQRYTESLTLKDYLVNNVEEIQNKYYGYLNQHKIFKSKCLHQITKEFISNDLYFKRNYLMQILIMTTSEFDDNNIIAYLLYDLLSNDSNGNIDNSDQIILIDSFPLMIRKYFKEAMKNTIQYTNDLTNFDMNKIPLEQQICLLKANDSVKEKAMLKLKEIKAKSEDSGSKARQYLDGLLKIPFQIYKKEPILNVMKNIKSTFLKIIKRENSHIPLIIPKKDKYTSIEILKYISLLKQNDTLSLEIIKNKIANYKKNELIKYALKINEIIDNKKISIFAKIKLEIKKKKDMKQFICQFIDFCFVNQHQDILNELQPQTQGQVQGQGQQTQTIIQKDIEIIEKNFHMIHEYMVNVKHILDTEIYGHEKAKKQIEMIVAQWINGKQSGYCFGFEGPPGVGKTSLAKNGLSKCLKDDDGECRPFAMIQIAGDSNGSTLHGHNYTYVGSTWGSIVQILIDKKCMNPIIFIDEVDKISKTEHGREIVGILTHLLDSTQNDCFQDKYFNGIELDLSKALFIISYNDPEAIDKILLDRVHRIKFNHLSLDDKLVICNKHLLPEMYTKVGLNGIIDIPNEVILFIIENYTYEAGVRKLKEILFEIIGEINLDILKKYNEKVDYPLPIVITIHDIKYKYFKDKHEVRTKKVHEENKVGVINCLYATTGGQSGILSANGQFFPSDKFLDLKLTGLLDEMMKESFHISMTLAYTLTNEENKKKLREKYDGEHKYGIHLHMGDGSVNKSGTSAGIAITLLFYSMLNNKKIKHTFAVTGEAGLDGLSNEIGALSQKFLGGIKAGVKSFLFPLENKKDYDDFMEKYKDNDIIKGIDFYPISTIHEAIELIFE